MQQRRYTTSEVEEIILRHAKPDGNIDFLFLDFEGQYTPICNRDEARLAAVLLSLYHNNACSADAQVFRVQKTLGISLEFESLPCACFAGKRASVGMREAVQELYAGTHGRDDDTYKWLSGCDVITVEQLCFLGIYCNNGIMWYDTCERDTALVVAVETGGGGKEQAGFVEASVVDLMPAANDEQDMQSLLEELESLTTSMTNTNTETKTGGDAVGE